MNLCIFNYVLKQQKRFSSQVCNNAFRPFKEIPGPKALPFIGSIYNYFPGGEYSFSALHKNALKNYRIYGPLVREQILPSVNLLHVYDPVDIESVFRNEGRFPDRRSHLALDHYRLSKSQLYKTGGLLATNGPEWYRLRSNFQKSITSPKAVKNFVQISDTIADEFGNEIKCLLQSNNIIQDFLPELNRLYLEMIAAITFGDRLNSFSAKEREDGSKTSQLIEAAFHSNSGILKLDQGLWWKVFETPLYKKLKKSQMYLEKISWEYVTNKTTFFDEKENLKNECLLDSFIQQNNVDFKDMIGMCVDILMAGIDTTSYSTSFLLYHLANNPRIQQELFNECLQLLPYLHSAVTDEILTLAQFMKACLKESLRLNPVSVGVGRIAQKEMVIQDYLIPKGTVIVTQNMIASRLYQYCDDPLEFKPDRWLRNSPNYQNVHPYLSLPFGFGPRSCIASRLAQQNILVAMMKIIRNYEVRWVGGEMDVETLLINKPNRDVTLMLTPRK